MALKSRSGALRASKFALFRTSSPQTAPGPVFGDVACNLAGRGPFSGVFGHMTSAVLKPVFGEWHVTFRALRARFRCFADESSKRLFGGPLASRGEGRVIVALRELHYARECELVGDSLGVPRREPTGCGMVNISLLPPWISVRHLFSFSPVLKSPKSAL